MGIAIGIVLVAGTIASLVMINLRAGRMAQRYNEQWTIDSQTGQPVPPQQGPGHGAQHHGGGHHGGAGGGGHFGGGHHGGSSGGDSGGGGHHH